MPAPDSSPRGRRFRTPEKGIYHAIQNISKTFRVTHAVALEALQAVGSDPEKIADFLKDRKR